jgi:hypothetical protein
MPELDKIFVGHISPSRNISQEPLGAYIKKFDSVHTRFIMHNSMVVLTGHPQLNKDK